MHIDLYIRRTGGKVDKTIAVIFVNHFSKFSVWREYPRYIRRRRERPELQRSVTEGMQKRVENNRTYAPALVWWYYHHVCVGLCPSCMIAVMFHMGYKHNRFSCRGQRLLR
ncbi:hypothetical protein D3C84_914120 [compost metagenome]